jgi:hypothetical protein
VLMEAYGELCARFYDLDKPRAPELAFEWYAARLNGRVFEPMCGSGRFLVPLLQRGLDVAGADPSPHMLAACRARLAAAGVDARLWQQSLEDLNVDAAFDVAFIPASSFCLLAPEAAREGLRRLRAVTARALIEFELPQAGADWPRESSRTVTDRGTQIRLVSRVDYEPATQTEVHVNDYELKRSGRVVQCEHEVLRLCCYSPQEMQEVLHRAGFDAVHVEHPEFGWVACAG